MRIFMVFCLLVISFSAHSFDLPKHVDLKSPAQSFTHEYDAAILEGKIWCRPRVAPPADLSRWELLGKTGLPAADSVLPFVPGGFDSPASVTALSADGDNLIAVGSDGYLYYMKWSTRKWMNKWGQPFSRKLRLPADIRSWSISHRGPLAGGFHDIDGNFHPVSVGVTTLYVLSEDGLNIHYADPWLPADFSSEICGPLRNRFRMRALAASASTLFVISDAGEMYTRLADFDTLGHNPFLSYSYERRERDIPREKDVRTLPPEGWKKQPSIPRHQGRITSAITIFQTGKGNDARELRVEGVNAHGAHGYFSKPIQGEAWTFTRTDLPLQKPLLSRADAVSDLGPDLDQILKGHLRAGRKSGDYEAQLRHFNPLCSGAILAAKLGTEEVELPFLTTASSRSDREMKGAVLLPAELKAKAATHEMLHEFIRTVFGEKSFLLISLTIDEQGTVHVKRCPLFSLSPEVTMEFAK